VLPRAVAHGAAGGPDLRRLVQWRRWRTPGTRTGCAPVLRNASSGSNVTAEPRLLFKAAAPLRRDGLRTSLACQYEAMPVPITLPWNAGRTNWRTNRDFLLGVAPERWIRVARRDHNRALPAIVDCGQAQPLTASGSAVAVALRAALREFDFSPGSNRPLVATWTA
jgi:hypothetical protein